MEYTSCANYVSRRFVKTFFQITASSLHLVLKRRVSYQTSSSYSAKLFHSSVPSSYLGKLFYLIGFAK